MKTRVLNALSGLAAFAIGFALALAAAAVGDSARGATLTYCPPGPVCHTVRLRRPLPPTTGSDNVWIGVCPPHADCGPTVPVTSCTTVGGCVSPWPTPTYHLRPMHEGQACDPSAPAPAGYRCAQDEPRSVSPLTGLPW